MAKIIVADDDLTTRALICRAVESLNHTAIHASNGTVAWNILRDNPEIKLLITDMMMPELNGHELINLVRTEHQNRDLPIIIISGVIKLSQILEIVEAGAYRFLPKPIDIAHLKQYIGLAIKPGRDNPDRNGLASPLSVQQLAN